MARKSPAALPKSASQMHKVTASPSTRRLALRMGVNLEELAEEIGTDTVARHDVERKIASGTNRTKRSHWDVDHAVWGPVRAEERTRFDRVAAAKLSATAATIPAVTTHENADVTELEQVRSRLNSEIADTGVKMTALAFHVMALAKTLAAFPRVNSSLSADGTTLYLKGYVSIGIAVDAPHGLVVPVIRGVDGKGLIEISREIADLAGRARARKIGVDEIGGASMSISNIGGIGGTGFTPMINAPEVAILGISRTSVVPVWDGAEFQPRSVTPLDLTYDHRVVNGAEAARFLRHHAGLLERPQRLLF